MRYSSNDSTCNSTPLEIERKAVAAYEKYSEELFSYAVALMHSDDNALDARQEVFLRYFIELSCGRRVEFPRAWLYRVLRNYLLDRMGVASVKHERFWKNIEEVPEPSSDPEQMIEQAQTAKEIAAMLTDREMDCLRLRSEHFSYDEIADILGVRQGTVSALLTRVHKKLTGSEWEKRSPRSHTVKALRFLLEKGGRYPS
jgi:RNA polymerase sigma factor (sigma-70 family)